MANTHRCLMIIYYFYTMSSTIQKPSISFLKDLSKNNNRDWFNKHKPRYIEAHQNICDFVDALIIQMKKHDTIDNESGRKSMHRIYSDTRFSKDKAPYNPRFSFRFSRSSKFRRGGYYMHLEPGNCFLAVGFFAPNPDDLLRIRHDISDNYAEWKKLLNKKSIKENYGELVGSQLSTSPKGFSKDDPAIELLRYKQFIFRHDFNDKEIYTNDFVAKTNAVFKSIRPWLDYMSEVLTTDRNGEVVV